MGNLDCIRVLLKRKVFMGREFREQNVDLEMPGIEPGAFHMQSERSTAELHPLRLEGRNLLPFKLTD